MIDRDRGWSGRCVRIVSASSTISDVSQTTSVEIDTELLKRLRERRPERSDRELLESMALIALGRATLRTMQKRNALTEDEAIALGVRAVREARQAGVSRLRAP